MSATHYTDHIVSRVANWPGLEATPSPSSDGGVELRIAGTVVGHVYDTGLVDLAFTDPIRDQLLTEGRADRHHRNPRSDWVSLSIRAPEDLKDVLWLLRLAYLLRLQSLTDAQNTADHELDLQQELARLGLSTPLRVLVSQPAEPSSDVAQSA